ncbi:MAG: esterase-like activity of phytase family protein [Gammaproteobacteria bacterium]|nr:esterase-like activity of phytase family protein [Gammaproteobacteria bacterium]
MTIAIVVNFPLPVHAVERARVTGIEYIGSAEFAMGAKFAGTEIGGLSGITYHERGNFCYVLSDDGSQRGPARLYSSTIDVTDGALDEGDVRFIGVTRLLETGGQFLAFAVTLEPVPRSGPHWRHRGSSMPRQ